MKNNNKRWFNMKKVLITGLTAIMLISSLTACSSNGPAPIQGNQVTPAPVQNARTLPAPAQGAPAAQPPQGITVNYKDFTIVDPKALSDKQNEMLELYKTSKGYTYWQDGGDFFIAIFAGEKQSAGYSIDVKSIEDNEGKTNILIDVVGPKDMAASVISYPYVVVKVTGIADNFNIQDTKGDTYSSISRHIDSKK
jgi:predicted small lipoprotein YifL